MIYSASKPFWAIRSTYKPVFHQYLPICCAYNAHKCLEREIWRSLCRRQQRQIYKLTALPLAHARGVKRRTRYPSLTTAGDLRVLSLWQMGSRVQGGHMYASAIHTYIGNSHVHTQRQLPLFWPHPFFLLNHQSDIILVWPNLHSIQINGTSKCDITVVCSQGNNGVQRITTNTLRYPPKTEIASFNPSDSVIRVSLEREKEIERESQWERACVERGRREMESKLKGVTYPSCAFRPVAAR